MVMDEAQEKILKNFLLVKKGDKPSQKRIISTYFAQPYHQRTIEAGKRQYPLEFVEHVHILVPESYLLQIYEQVRLSLTEKRERAMVLVCQVGLPFKDLAEVEVTNLMDMAALERELGPLERTKHGINVAKLHEYCRLKSSGALLYSHVHTHTQVGSIEISMADKISYRLGQMAYVAALHEDGGLALVPYRMDSRSYKEQDSFDFTHFRAFTLAVICDHPEALDKSILDNFTRQVNRRLVKHQQE